jgi:hypothetical protein
MKRLLLPMAVFILLGTPLVAYIWETLNLLVAGHVDLVRLVILVPAVALLAGLLVLLSRTVANWESERTDAAARSPSSSRDSS